MGRNRPGSVGGGGGTRRQMSGGQQVVSIKPQVMDFGVLSGHSQQNSAANNPQSATMYCDPNMDPRQHPGGLTKAFPPRNSTSAHSATTAPSSRGSSRGNTKLDVGFDRDEVKLDL